MNEPKDREAAETAQATNDQAVGLSRFVRSFSVEIVVQPMGNALTLPLPQKGECVSRIGFSYPGDPESEKDVANALEGLVSMMRAEKHPVDWNEFNGANK
jgi:hypothetical protein